MKFGWKIILGSIIGFLGSAFRTVEGVGGGGIFVPVLTLVVIFIFVIMRLVLLAIFGLEYLI